MKLAAKSPGIPPPGSIEPKPIATMNRKSHLTPAWLVAIALSFTTAPAFSQQDRPTGAEPGQSQSAEPLVTEMIATIKPLGENKVRGTVHFQKVSDGVRVTAQLSGLQPGQQHGFHIHEFGDLSAEDGKSAGDHFNPHGQPHGLPDQEERHAGDFGNLTADDQGNATHSLTVRNLSFSGTHSILGRAVIVHSDPDDGSQPSGNAGDRIGGGVIGVARGGLATGPLTPSPPATGQRQTREGEPVPDTTRPTAQPPREKGRDAPPAEPAAPIPGAETNPGPRPDSSGGALGGISIPPPDTRVDD
jgi:superoxide dismutase, Cu-Zn family